MADVQFAEGVWFNDKPEKAPDWVIGKIAIKPETFVKWLRGQKPDAKGYVKLDIKRSRNGKPNISLDTWVPNKKEELEDDDIPW